MVLPMAAQAIMDSRAGYISIDTAIGNLIVDTAGPVRATTLHLARQRRQRWRAATAICERDRVFSFHLQCHYLGRAASM